MLAVTLYIATLASSASVHHSHSHFYDECKSITIEGRVERVEFKDPHTWIVLGLDDGTAYTVDWAGLSRLMRAPTLPGRHSADRPWARQWMVINR
jgi:hypothetical protein